MAFHFALFWILVTCHLCHFHPLNKGYSNSYDPTYRREPRHGRPVLAMANSSRCMYNGEQIDDGRIVPSPEPCLNCTCSKGVLLCYLQVCPTVVAPSSECYIGREQGYCCPRAICRGSTRSISTSARITDSADASRSHARTTSEKQPQEERNSPPTTYNPQFLRSTGDFSTRSFIDRNHYSSYTPKPITTNSKKTEKRNSTFPSNGHQSYENSRPFQNRTENDGETISPSPTTTLALRVHEKVPTSNVPYLSEKDFASANKLGSTRGHPTAPALQKNKVPNDKTDNKDSSGSCSLKGILYIEGMAMLSPTKCEYCYCIRGQKMCVRPKCHLTIDGCVARYHSGFTCCPSHYQCELKYYEPSENRNSPGLSTDSTAVPASKNGGSFCRIEGFDYEVGVAVPSRGHCQTCYCTQRGVVCRKLECSPRVHGCEPVLPDGHCCPREYSCNSSITSYYRVPTSHSTDNYDVTVFSAEASAQDPPLPDINTLLGVTYTDDDEEDAPQQSEDEEDEEDDEELTIHLRDDTHLESVTILPNESLAILVMTTEEADDNVNNASDGEITVTEIGENKSEQTVIPISNTPKHSSMSSHTSSVAIPTTEAHQAAYSEVDDINKDNDKKTDEPPISQTPSPLFPENALPPHSDSTVSQGHSYSDYDYENPADYDYLQSDPPVSHDDKVNGFSETFSPFSDYNPPGFGDRISNKSNHKNSSSLTSTNKVNMRSTKPIDFERGSPSPLSSTTTSDDHSPSLVPKSPINNHSNMFFTTQRAAQDTYTNPTRKEDTTRDQDPQTAKTATNHKTETPRTTRTHFYSTTNTNQPSLNPNDREDDESSNQHSSPADVTFKTTIQQTEKSTENHRPLSNVLPKDIAELLWSLTEVDYPETREDKTTISWTDSVLEDLATSMKYADSVYDNLSPLAAPKLIIEGSATRHNSQTMETEAMPSTTAPPNQLSLFKSPQIIFSNHGPSLKKKPLPSTQSSTFPTAVNNHNKQVPPRVPIRLRPSLMTVRPQGIALRPSPIMARPSPMTARPSPMMARPSPMTARPSLMMARPSPMTARPSLIMARPSPMTARPSLIMARPSLMTARPSQVPKKPEIPFLVEFSNHKPSHSFQRPLLKAQQQLPVQHRAEPESAKPQQNEMPYKILRGLPVTPSPETSKHDAEPPQKQTTNVPHEDKTATDDGSYYLTTRNDGDDTLQENHSEKRNETFLDKVDTRESQNEKPTHQENHPATSGEKIASPLTKENNESTNATTSVITNKNDPTDANKATTNTLNPTYSRFQSAQQQRDVITQTAIDKVYSPSSSSPLEIETSTPKPDNNEFSFASVTKSYNKDEATKTTETFDNYSESQTQDGGKTTKFMMSPFSAKDDLTRETEKVVVSTFLKFVPSGVKNVMDGGSISSDKVTKEGISTPSEVMPQETVASTLHPTLVTQKLDQFYNANRRNKTPPTPVNEQDNSQKTSYETTANTDVTSTWQVILENKTTGSMQQTSQTQELPTAEPNSGQISEYKKYDHHNETKLYRADSDIYEDDDKDSSSFIDRRLIPYGAGYSQRIPEGRPLPERPANKPTPPPPPPAQPPQSPQEVIDVCFVDGRYYTSGEIIVKSNPCEMCRCFYGHPLCQVQQCPPPPGPACVLEYLPGYCCPRVTCGTKLDSLRPPSDVNVTPIPPPLRRQPPLLTSDNQWRPLPPGYPLISGQNSNTSISTNQISSSSSNQVLSSVTQEKPIVSEPGGKIRTTLIPTTEKEKIPSQIFKNEANSSGLNQSLENKDHILPQRHIKTSASLTTTTLSENPTTLPPTLTERSDNTEKKSHNKSAAIHDNSSGVRKAMDGAVTLPASKIDISPQRSPDGSTVLPGFHTRATEAPEPALVTEMTHQYDGESLDDIPAEMAGLLKVAGCNVYGKYYKVNDQVSVLSQTCKECVCSAEGIACTAIC